MNSEELQQSIRAAVTRLAAASQRAKAAANALKPLLGNGGLASLPRVQRSLLALHKIGEDSLRELELHSLLGALEQWKQEAPQRLRSEFYQRLREACTQRGLKLNVVRREEPPELRVVPLSLVLDLQRSRATWQFAREPLREVDLEVGAVLQTYDQLLSELERKGFEPGEFHTRCYRAYREALFTLGKQPGERVEFEHFLPRLALQLQQRAFLRSPRQRLFREYSRAHFAYDVWRLRRAGRLIHNGWRLNLGVATGDTARQPERVIYFEDGEGNGEYKLNIFFTQAEVPPAEATE
jgi:hypothetical protein